MLSKSTALASAAALLFVAGAAYADPQQGTAAGKVKCEGANSCKGRGSCHSATNECAGRNSCKGKGFLMMNSQEECDQAKAKIKSDMEGDK
ncbi:MAG TPA: hypothetical protein VFY49_11850 [Myxococcota bacterium]|nr:hypothetical protein [Myxococcota bacterium]